MDKRQREERRRQEDIALQRALLWVAAAVVLEGLLAPVSYTHLVLCRYPGGCASVRRQVLRPSEGHGGLRHPPVCQYPPVRLRFDRGLFRHDGIKGAVWKTSIPNYHGAVLLPAGDLRRGRPRRPRRDRDGLPGAYHQCGGL